ncbi:MAG: hypothetical protein OXI44_05160 [Bacteroidota bacterium]|nr:hypothetical protein [Bacteroidota bacterium]
MTKPEYFICIGGLVPEDNELGMPETPLRSRHDDWITTTAIRCSKVFIKLEIPGDYTEIDPRALRDLVVREAQNTAQMWLSVIGFVEGASYSTRISTIEDSTGCIRALGPKPRFGPRSEDLRIENAKGFAGAAAVLSGTNEHFRRALHDYVTALNFTPDSPFYLYRALDSLRKHFDNDWENMHLSLGTSKSRTDELLTTYANKIRHGESLDQQMLFNAYRGHHKALKYVRNALRTFLIKNNQADINPALPNLGPTVVPDITANPDFGGLS